MVVECIIIRRSLILDNIVSTLVSALITSRSDSYNRLQGTRSSVRSPKNLLMKTVFSSMSKDNGSTDFAPELQKEIAPICSLENLWQ